MSDTATITDARLAFVRDKPFDPLPPPLTALRRDRLAARKPVFQRAQHRC